MRLSQAPESTGHLYRILDSSADTAIRASLKTPVRQMKCEQGETMNKHMRKALQAKQHPEVTFGLNRVTNKQIKHSDSKDTPTTVTANLHGDLAIAGTTREITLPVRARVTDDGIDVNGQYALKLTDYNIEPPTVMWTITVYDDVTIHLDATLKKAASASSDE